MPRLDSELVLRGCKLLLHVAIRFKNPGDEGDDGGAFMVMGFEQGIGLESYAGLPPTLSLPPLIRLVGALEVLTAEQIPTRIAQALEYMQRVVTKRAVVFLISACPDDGSWPSPAAASWITTGPAAETRCSACR